MSSSLIRKCKACSVYTLLPECPQCKGPTSTPHPARYSPMDPYARYRRALMQEIRIKS